MEKDTLIYSKKTLKIRSSLITLDSPIIMGIINVTPDSFYEDSRKVSHDTLISQARKMISEGATILDIGGYSSRPGASHISEKEELGRVCTAIESIISAEPNAIISVDTFRSEVAKSAVEAGASIINDISAGNLDSKMFETVARLNVPYVMMHMKGTPQDMANQTHYDDLVDEVINYFQEKIIQLKRLGVSDIILDPGFGFSKTLEQNYELLSNLSKLKILDFSILVGLSRKSMIYKKLEISPNEALNGTSILNTVATLKGANILRVHDVKEAKELITLSQMLH